ncbi:MAG: NAD(P)/FAD-dependent oxidoreductase [Nitrospinae bacterium]|nr:NAD(P)/FAD-dependent oxidoreductase [Nitrospinota bacterium]MBI3814339.1 NAD(P)/FAD-dependent oxidoreductase [Nitrospinota bacterium]
MQKVIIIGNGAAGTAAAEVIRKNNKDISISIYSDEPYPFYSRIKLPHFLGDEIAQENTYIYRDGWYKENGIEFHPAARIKKIEAAEKYVITETGEKAHYDKLLFATGSANFIPPIKGREKRGFFTLRTIKDVLSIKEYSSKGKNAVLIGGGLLGLEAARGLKVRGLDVTVVEFFSRLLPRQLDEKGAKVLQRLIENIGIKVVLSGESDEVLGKDNVTGLRLKDGRTIECSLIIISAGITPRIELAKEAGIAVNKGIIINERMETSIKNVYAAGDCAEFQGRIYGLWTASSEQGTIAGNNISGVNAIYNGTVPSTTLKIVGIDLTSIGIVNPLSPPSPFEGEGKGEGGFKELIREDGSNGVYKKLVVKEGKIVGAILLGDTKDVRVVSKLIKNGVDVSKYEDNLRDAKFDLKKIA